MGKVIAWLLLRRLEQADGVAQHAKGVIGSCAVEAVFAGWVALAVHHGLGLHAPLHHGHQAGDDPLAIEARAQDGVLLRDGGQLVDAVEDLGAVVPARRLPVVGGAVLDARGGGGLLARHAQRAAAAVGLLLNGQTRDVEAVAGDVVLEAAG